MTVELEVRPSDQRNPRVAAARLRIGLIVLICAEVFSGASLQMGIWHPWTLLVTYWLYFAHFFFLTTLAVYTARTSLWSLYLWGVLFGLYESWITKVIWFGYGGDGKMMLGRLGPYGFAESSMVFIFHPVMSFLLPLAVACLLYPDLRRFFPDLAWFTARTRAARIMRAYLVFSLSPVVGLNSGGPLNLVLNLAFVCGVFLILTWLARTGSAAKQGRSVVVFGRWGFVALCVYLAVLYGVAYLVLKPEGLPSVRVQLLTLFIYAVIVLGLMLHRPRESVPSASVPVEPPELSCAMAVFAWVIGLGFVLSFGVFRPVLMVPIVLNSVLWTLLGLALTAIALWQGVGEFRGQRPGRTSRKRKKPGLAGFTKISALRPIPPWALREKDHLGEPTHSDHQPSSTISPDHPNPPAIPIPNSR